MVNMAFFLKCDTVWSNRNSQACWRSMLPPSLWSKRPTPKRRCISSRLHGVTYKTSVTFNFCYYCKWCSVTMGRDSSVSIATRYVLEGLGIESRWRREFPHQSSPAPGPTQPSVQWVLDLFPGGKAAGAWS
jgi:hypothetical protein